MTLLSHNATTAIRPEGRLGVKLFDRDQRNVALTVAGAILLQEMRKILAALERAERLTRRAARGQLGSLL